MAQIAAKIQSIDGECTLDGYEDQVEAVAIRESIVLSAARSSGRATSARTAGRSRHSDICLVRYKDRASPKFAEACSSGANIGTVTISLFRTLETGTTRYMTYTLTETLISRYEVDTLDREGRAFGPSMGSARLLPPSWGVAGLLEKGQGDMAPAPRLLSGGSRGEPLNREVERIWLNAAAVKWSYESFVNGASQGTTEKGWSFQKGVEQD